MFRYNVRGENIEVTEAIRDYVEKKVSKLERYFTDVPEATAHVNLKVYTEKTAKVEVTIPLPYLVLRAEETICKYRFGSRQIGTPNPQVQNEN